MHYRNVTRAIEVLVTIRFFRQIEDLKLFEDVQKGRSQPGLVMGALLHQTEDALGDAETALQLHSTARLSSLQLHLHK